MRGVLAVAMLAGSIAFNAAPVHATPYASCGRLVSGLECPVLFQAGDGRRFLLENLDAFDVGDRVCVSGDLDALCATACPGEASGGCIRDNDIFGPCSPFQAVRHPADISCGPDLGGTAHTALNFRGSAGSGGDTWFAVYDTTPQTPEQIVFTGSVDVSADVLVHRFNNKKGAGLMALFSEAGQQGLVLVVYDNGNTDSLTLARLDAGRLTTLKSIALHAGIREDAWYRLTMEILVSGDNLSVMGRVFSHAASNDPNSPLAAQVGPTLLTPNPLSLTALGLQNSGEVGIVATAISAVVDSSVTNFTADTGQ